MSWVDDWVHATKRALVGWDPNKHPRGRDGKFLEVGDLVSVFTGPNSGQVDSGKIVAGHFAADGRFFAAISSARDGQVRWYRPKQIEQINPKATLNPLAPIPDVGMQGEKAHVPWSAADAETVAGAQKSVLESLSNKVAAGETDTAKKAVKNFAGYKAKGGGDPWEATVRSAAEVAKKQHGLDYGTESDVPASWKDSFQLYKSPSAIPATNALKDPVKLSGSEWATVKSMLDLTDSGAGEHGFGFDSKGLDLVVTDYPKFKQYAEQQMEMAKGGWGMELPAVAALLERVTSAWEAVHPPTPQAPHGTTAISPVVTTPAPKTSKGHGILSITPGQAHKLPAGKQPADLIRAIQVSAANKFGHGSDLTNAVSNEINAALTNPNHAQAHKHLAVAMTVAKLGGKQRARYKTLLDMHFGVELAPKSQAPSPDAKGTAVTGGMSPVMPKGLSPNAVLGLQTGNEWVQTGSGGNAGQAKGNVQRAIAQRMADVPLMEMAKLLSGSPGMHPNGQHVKLVDVWTSGHYDPDKQYLYQSHGSWVINPRNTSGLPASNGIDRFEINKENLEKAIRMTAVNALIQTWASASNDNNVRSLALQDLAIQEFSLDPAWIFNWHSKPPLMSAHLKAHSATYRKFLRAMYDNTQAEFAKSGVKYVRLRRGVNAAPTQKSGASLTGKTKRGSIAMRPMSSYSSNTATAKGFGHYVHESYVPVERIIGSARTGFGCLNEYEYVVLGGPNVVEVYQG